MLLKPVEEEGLVLWMCHVKLKDRKYSDELTDWLWMVSIRKCIKRGRLRWFGHVERMDKDSGVKKGRKVVVEGHRGRRMDKGSWVKKGREVVVEAHRGRTTKDLGWGYYTRLSQSNEYTT